MANKALNKLRSFSESMASDIQQLSRSLIVGKQQVLYPRQGRYHGTYVSVDIFSCFVYGFFHLLCSVLRALVRCYHYPCRCPVFIVLNPSEYYGQRRTKCLYIFNKVSLHREKHEEEEKQEEMKIVTVQISTLRVRNVSSFVGDSCVKTHAYAGNKKHSGDGVTVDSGKKRSLTFN